MSPSQPPHGEVGSDVASLLLDITALRQLLEELGETGEAGHQETGAEHRPPAPAVEQMPQVPWLLLERDETGRDMGDLEIIIVMHI